MGLSSYSVCGNIRKTTATAAATAVLLLLQQYVAPNVNDGDVFDSSDDEAVKKKKTPENQNHAIQLK